MAPFTSCGSRRKDRRERAAQPDQGDHRDRGRGAVHEGHAAIRDVRQLAPRARGAAAGGRSGDRGRHPARPADPRGALGALRLADDPAGLRRRRACRRRRHRRGARGERRARADAAREARRRVPRRRRRAGSRRRLTALDSLSGSIESGEGYMSEVAATPSAESRRRTSLYVSGAIALAVVVVGIVFAASAPWYFVFKMLHVSAAVVWVGGGLFLTICALLAELADNDDQLLQIGHWAEVVAGRLFPLMSFV